MDSTPLEESVSDVYEFKLEVVDGVDTASDVDELFARYFDELVDGNADDIVYDNVDVCVKSLPPAIMGVEEVIGDPDMEFVISAEDETVAVPGVSPVDIPCENGKSDEMDSAAASEDVLVLVKSEERETSPSELEVSEDAIDELCDASKLPDIVEFKSSVSSVLVAVMIVEPDDRLEVDVMIIE